MLGVIGPSSDPWWHGSLNDLRANLAFMARHHDQDVMLMEVACNGRPAECRDKPGPIASRDMFDREGNALPVIGVFDQPAATEEN